MGRAGRKRKAGVARDRTGKSRGEGPEQAIAIALAQPHRRWSKTPRDALLGYPLGRLLLAGYITDKQHEAGQRWVTVVRRYAALIGFPRETPDAPNWVCPTCRRTHLHRAGRACTSALCRDALVERDPEPAGGTILDREFQQEIEAVRDSISAWRQQARSGVR